MHDVAHFLQKELQHTVQHLHIQVRSLKPSSSTNVLLKSDYNIDNDLNDGLDTLSTGFRSLLNSGGKAQKMKLHPYDSIEISNHPSRVSSEPNFESHRFLSVPEESNQSVIDFAVESLDSISSNGVYKYLIIIKSCT